MSASLFAIRDSSDYCGQYHIDCLPEYDTDVCSIFLLTFCLLNVLIFDLVRWNVKVCRRPRAPFYPLTLNLKLSRFLVFTPMLNLTTDFGAQSVISLEGKAKNTDEDASFATDLVIKETKYFCPRVSQLLKLSKRNSAIFQSFHVIIWRR